MRARDALRKANVTHVVSALRLPLDETLFTDYKHLVVELDDVEDEDILQHFPRSNAFIQEGLDDGGSVLVHWYLNFHICCSLLDPFSMYPAILEKVISRDSVSKLEIHGSFSFDESTSCLASI